MLHLKQLLRLYTKGLSKVKISKQLGLSHNTVKKYISLFHEHRFSYEELSKLNSEEIEDLFETTVLEPDGKEKNPRKLLPLCYQEAEENRCYPLYSLGRIPGKVPDSYCYSQFCHYIGNLGGSRMVFVEATRTQGKEDFLASLTRSLNYYGGVPAAIVPDNLKSAVKKSDKYEPQINDSLQDFALHYSTTILPTRTYHPKDKALVENAVRIVYTCIFAPLRKHNSSSVLKNLIQASESF